MLTKHTPCLPHYWFPLSVDDASVKIVEDKFLDKYSHLFTHNNLWLYLSNKKFNLSAGFMQRNVIFSINIACCLHKIFGKCSNFREVVVSVTFYLLS